MIIAISLSCQSSNTTLIIDSGNPKAENIHEFITKACDNNQFNGAVLVGDKGNIIYKNIFGSRDFESNKRINNKSVFRLASVSKQFTAFAVLILVDRKQLSLSGKLKDIFPSLTYDKITIHDLLTHTSGLLDYMDLLENYWETDVFPENNDVINLLAKFNPEPHFTSGTKWEYSNTGYVLLASIIEKVSEMEFGEFLSENIFDPLDMQNSFLLDYGEKNNYLNRVIGFDKIDKVENDHHYLNKIKGDGGIYSNLSDLYKWDRFLNRNTLIGDTLFNKVFTPYVLTDDSVSFYGYGWFIDKNRAVQYHSGSWLGLKSYFYRDTNNQRTIILLDNSSNPLFEELQIKIHSILNEEEYPQY